MSDPNEEHELNDHEEREPEEGPEEPEEAASGSALSMAWEAIRPPSWQGLEEAPAGLEEEPLPELGEEPPAWRVPQRGGFAGAPEGGSQRGLAIWPEFQDQAVPARTMKMRVERERLDGVRESLGHMPIGVSEEALAYQHGPGDYWLTPVNHAGKPLVREDLYICLPPDHPIFLSRASGGRGGQGVGAGQAAAMQQAAAQSSIEAMLKHLKEQSDREAERRELEQQRIADRERELRAAEIEAAKATANLGNKAAERSESAMMRVVELTKAQSDAALAATRAAFEKAQADSAAKEAELEKRRREVELKAIQQVENQSKSFAEMLLAQTNLARQEAQAREAEREREFARREAERKQEAAEREARQQQWLQMQLAMMAQQAEAQEKARQAELERQREHQALMLEAMKAQLTNSNPVGALGTIVAQAAPILMAVGIEPADIGEKLKDLFSGGEPEAPRSTLSELAELAIEGMKTWRAMGSPMPNMPQIAGPGQVTVAPPPQLEQREPLPIPGVAQLPPSVAVPATPTAAIPPAPAVPAVPPVPAAPVDPVAALPKDQRQRARKAISALVKKLQAEPDTEWEATVTAAMLTGAADILPYLKARTIRGAAEDAGASSEQTERFIALLDKFEQAKDIPRG